MLDLPGPGGRGSSPSFLEMFRSAVRTDRDAIAVVEPGRSVTYGTLDDAANRLAGVLSSSGVRPGGRVALLLRPSAALIAGIIAVQEASGCCVLLDLRPRLPRTVHGKVDRMALTDEVRSAASLRGPARRSTPGGAV